MEVVRVSRPAGLENSCFHNFYVKITWQWNEVKIKKSKEGWEGLEGGQGVSLGWQRRGRDGKVYRGVVVRVGVGLELESSWKRSGRTKWSDFCGVDYSPRRYFYFSGR